MVKHTQTIRRLFADEFFEHFVKLALNRLTLRTEWLMNNIFTKKKTDFSFFVGKVRNYLLLMAFKRCFNYTWHCIISPKYKSVTVSYLKDLLKTFCNINRQGHNYFFTNFCLHSASERRMLMLRLWIIHRFSAIISQNNAWKTALS